MRRKTMELWLTHVAAWEESGLSQKEFCVTHGLSYPSFNYWVRKHEAKPSGAAELELVELPVAGRPASENILVQLAGVELLLGRARLSVQGELSLDHLGELARLCARINLEATCNVHS